MNSLQKFVLFAGLSLVPPSVESQKPLTEQVVEAVKVTMEACTALMGDVLMNEQFAEERFGNREVQDDLLREQLQDLEAKGVEWCVNGILHDRLPGVSTTCVVKDIISEKSEFRCTAVNQEVSPILEKSGFLVVEGCEVKYENLIEWIRRFGAIASENGKNFEIGNTSVEPFVDKAMEVCAQWQVVQP